MPIHFIGASKATKNSLQGFLLDNEDYTVFQLKLISDLIKIPEPSKILFLDFFNPGLEILKYFHEQKNISVKYGALIHGGTFFDDDIYNMPWLNASELAWAEIYSVVYIASNSAKKKLPNQIRNKAKAIPWGLDNFARSQSNKLKKYDVIFPHRLSPDKGTDDLIKIVKSLPKIQFAITAPQDSKTLSSNPYYQQLKKLDNVTFILQQNQRQHAQTLSQARMILSCAKQETFGYAVIKAVLNGCIPILPYSQCYPDFFKTKYLYRNLPEAIHNIQKYKKLDTEGSSSPFKSNDVDLFSFQNHLEDFFGKK